jgi:D-aminoacyl-tRNA deacylase
MANTIIRGLRNENTNYKIAIGIGGPHYCSNFNKIALRTDIAFSHFCPKYHLDKLNEDLIRQSIERTKEKVDFILLDWKGLGTEKQRIVELLKNMNLEMGRSDHTLKN